jgi:hypothetical protein
MIKTAAEAAALILFIATVMIWAVTIADLDRQPPSCCACHASDYKCHQPQLR